MREAALIVAVILFLWGGAGIFQILRGLIFAPLKTKKDERHD